MDYQKTFEKVNRDLALLAPVVQRKAVAALDECQAMGYPAAIFEGFRTPARQAILYRQSRDTGKWATDALPWQSFHQYGVAIDLAFQTNGKWSKDSWADSWPWDKVASIFISHGFEWPKPKGEKAHFQITGGLKISEMNAIHRDQGIPAIWSVLQT